MHENKMYAQYFILFVHKITTYFVNITSHMQVKFVNMRIKVANISHLFLRNVLVLVENKQHVNL